MKQRLYELVKSGFRAAGFELHRRQQTVARNQWLRMIGIDTVFDIGANTGQFAAHIRDLLPEATIYSFEPLQDCYAELVRGMATDPKFRAFNVALSDAAGSITFHRSSSSASSSILPMADLHKEAFPTTAGETVVTVQADTLDHIASGLQLGRHLLLKLDVQGAEEKVFRGGPDTLAKADVVIAETSFQRIYEGQMLFADIFALMQAAGFRYLGGEGGYLENPLDGSNLVEDSIFVATRLLRNDRLVVPQS